MNRITEIDLQIRDLISRLLKSKDASEIREISLDISDLQSERVKLQRHPVFDRIESILSK